ncbi:MAG TPA: phosphate acyltransferase [Gemmatimonadales bacterium]|nr:phosphate acyltransferase [Gemmatimonadales bacterium]
MKFRDSVYERARRARRRLVLPEGADPRVRAAAAKIEALGIASVQLLEGPTPHSPLPEMIRLLRDRHPNRFPNDATAAAALEHPLTRGAALVALGRADVMVGGATYPSGDTIRAALWTVGTAEGITTVSGAFYLVRDDAVLTFTDCAVVPEPTPEQLADSGIAAARDRRRIVGDEPVVAFLSYSTKGSASGPRVTRVRQAVELLGAHRPLPDFAFDGELQTDAALVADVAARKAAGSRAGGRANVLVFPDLDSGNIGYKLVQRLGGWEAIGPILQGLARPVADLSRGATADDIVDTAAVAVLQAQEHS